MKLLLTAILLVVSQFTYGLSLDEVKEQVRQRELTFYYIGPSYHWISEDTTNSIHHMVALRYDNLVVGRFNNSYGVETYFAGYYNNFWRRGRLSSPIILGLMHGYTYCIGHDDSSKNVCPLFAIGLEYDLKDSPIDLVLIQLGDATTGGFKYDF